MFCLRDWSKRGHSHMTIAYGITLQYREQRGTIHRTDRISFKTSKRKSWTTYFFLKFKGKSSLEIEINDSWNWHRNNRHISSNWRNEPICHFSVNRSKMCYHRQSLLSYLFHNAVRLCSSSLWRRTDAQKVSFKNCLQWPLNIINSVDKPSYLSIPPTEVGPQFLWKLIHFFSFFSASQMSGRLQNNQAWMSAFSAL